MAITYVTMPIEYFPDPTKGKPVYNGSVYVGQPNLDPEIEANRISVTLRQQDGNEVVIPPEAQPLTTGAGGVILYEGSSVTVLAEGNYSIKVLDKFGAQVYYVENAFDGEPITGDQVALVFDTVADLKAANFLSIGNLARTKGYYTPGDGGQATYLVAAAQAVDGFGDHELANGNVALLQVSGAVNALQFGLKNDGADVSDPVAAMWVYCLDKSSDMYFPAGIYNSVEKSFPMGRINGLPPESLLDCKGITVYGDGYNTVLKTTSDLGADVLQFNGAKNIHVRDIKITADLITQAGAGSNAISVTGGGEDLTFKDILAYNLPYVDKTSFLDGGKGFTIQMSSFTTELRNIQFNQCVADGCVYGFDYNPQIDDVVGEPVSVQFNDCVAKNCYRGFISSSGAATGSIPDGFSYGLIMTGDALECQFGVSLGRVYGAIVDVQVRTAKSRSDLIKNPSGSNWSSANVTTYGLLCAYAKNSAIRVQGYLSDIDYKASIGGAASGASGLSGATDQCEIYLDIGGISAVADIEAVDSFGNSLSFSELKVTGATGVIPTDFYLPAKENILVYGTATRLGDLKLSGALSFADTDGELVYSSIEREGFGIYGKQTGVSAGSGLVIGAKDNTGAVKAAFTNDGQLAGGKLASATSVATVNGVIALYDLTQTNTVIGYIPLYDTFS